MAKLGTQALKFKSVTERQTNSMFLATPMADEIQTQINLAVGTVTEDLEHVLAPLKHLVSDA